MKAKYTSTTPNLLQNNLALVFVFVLSLIAVWTLALYIFIKIIISIAAILLLFWRIQHVKKSSFYCSFFEDHMHIKYDYQPKEIKRHYADIIKFRYSSGHKSDDLLRFDFKSGEPKRIKIKSPIDHDAFIDFVKWMKSKNEAMEVSVHPSNHILNHKLQEEYGVKYRKVRNPESE